MWLKGQLHFSRAFKYTLMKESADQEEAGRSLTGAVLLGSQARKS